jgi:hypothetical protein
VQFINAARWVVKQFRLQNTKVRNGAKKGLTLDMGFTCSVNFKFTQQQACPDQRKLEVYPAISGHFFA